MQYFTLPHMIRRIPADSSGIRRSLMDSRHVTYRHMVVRRIPAGFRWTLAE